MKYMEDLLWIKEVMGLSMNDLALALDIPCPTLYHWLDDNAPPDPKHNGIYQVRLWLEKNIEDTYRKKLKQHWYHQIDNNLTLLKLLHRLSNGESLGKIKMSVKLKRNLVKMLDDKA